MASSTSYLIDTHIFIWWMQKSPKLPVDIMTLLTNSREDIYLSVASVWEMIIKRQKKKLKTPSIPHGVREGRFGLLEIKLAHVLCIESLPPYHNDPFDRLLIAQAITEGLILISSDEKIARYNVPLLRA